MEPGEAVGSHDLVGILPARNEAESLPRVLADLPPVGLIVVIFLARAARIRRRRQGICGSKQEDLMNRC